MKLLLAGLLLTLSLSAQTRLYTRTTTPTNNPTAGTKSTALPTGTSVNCSPLDRALSTTIGSVSTTQNCGTAAQTTLQSGMIMRFSSEALAAQTINANTWTVMNNVLEGNAAANAFTALSIYVWRPGSSSVVGYVYDNAAALGIEWPTTQTNKVVTVSGSAVTTQENDILVIEYWYRATQGMTGPYTNTLTYAGANDTTDANTADGASYLETPQTLTFAGGGGPTTSIKSPIMRGRLGPI